MADVLVSGIKISEMELVNDISGTEKMPTDQVGDKAVSIDQILIYVNNKVKPVWGNIQGNISTQTDLINLVDNKINDILPVTTENVLEGDSTQFKINESFRKKDSERLSPFDYNAVGDGVTDDTDVFKNIESSEITKSEVDLAGATYSIKSSAESQDGVTLTKNYVNGTLIVDGRELIFDRHRNFSMSSASINRMGQSSTSKMLGIKKVTENNYEIWRPLGGQYWQQIKLNRTTNNVPLNWQETRIKQVLGYIASEDGNTYTGGWSVIDATTGLSSGDYKVYIGGRARQSQTVGDYVEINYNGGGDLYVVYAGRTSGNYVNVLIDGKQDFISLPNDINGNKYFDSYSPTDLQYKKLVKIASGVPNGQHVIRLTLSNQKNPSSTGGRFIFNALAFDSQEIGPWRSEADAKPWKTAENILINQVRKYGSNYYYATTSGTTGISPPTHTSGSVSDGGVTWAYRPLSGYDLVDSAIQVAGSQLEYAYEMLPEGAINKEDVGGALHGNEVQTALNIYVGNNKSELLNNTWLTGDVISIQEENYSTHSEISNSTVPIIKTTLLRTFKRQWVEMYHRHKIQKNVTLGYFYPHMFPVLHYHGPVSKFAVEKIWSSGDGDRICSEYYGRSNPIVGRTKDTLMIAYGRCLQPDGAGGIPTSEKAPLSFSAWLSVDPSSVDSYDSADSVFCGKAMNISGADITNGGYSSMTSKMYFERYSARSPKLLKTGETFECFARYGLDIFPNI